jgi:hypothetical protein
MKTPKPPKPLKDRILPEDGPISKPEKCIIYDEFMEEDEEFDTYVPPKFSNKNRKKGRKKNKLKKMKE